MASSKQAAARKRFLEMIAAKKKKGSKATGTSKKAKGTGNPSKAAGTTKAAKKSTAVKK